MNKLLIDEQVNTLNNFEGEIKITSKNCLLHLKGVNKITKLTLTKDATITLELHDKSKLSFEDYWSCENQNISIIINSKNETTLVLNLAIETQTDYHLKLKNNLNGSHNKSQIQIRALTERSGSISIESTGYIAPQTQNNEFQEELKGLTLNQQSILFLPNLIVETDDVIASHNATIKCIDDDELFYLQSKGISKEESIDLIKQGFLNYQKQGGENYES
jgi:hypothetical protein